MSKAWAIWNFTAEGKTLLRVPNFDSWEALQYLYGLDNLQNDYGYSTLMYMLDAVEYVGQCLDDGRFDSRFFDECAYLELTIEAWQPEPYTGTGTAEEWIYVKSERDRRRKAELDAELAAVLADINF